MMHNSQMKTKILLIGGNGQVGHALQSSLQALGELVVCTRAELDLGVVGRGADHVAHCPISALVSSVKPNIVVNAAAYTAVDRAETETELANSINVVAPGLLSRAAHTVGACMVHYSTDYVYAGIKKTPYVETDETQPLSVYGRTKLEGERAVAEACPRHLIFRTSWVVGAHGGNFLKTMLKLGLERDHLRVVADQIGAPTSAKLIAQITSHLLETMFIAPGTDPRWGRYHLAASGQTSWFYYAQYVLSQARARGWPIKVADDNIEAIATADYPVAAPRPHNSKLDTSKIRQTFNVVLPDWTEGVDDVLAELFKQYSASSQESPQGLSR